MRIGPPKRVIDVEPLETPVPGVLPDPMTPSEPAAPDADPAEPLPESTPEPAEPSKDPAEPAREPAEP